MCIRANNITVLSFGVAAEKSRQAHPFLFEGEKGCWA